MDVPNSCPPPQETDDPIINVGQHLSAFRKIITSLHRSGIRNVNSGLCNTYLGHPETIHHLTIHGNPDATADCIREYVELLLLDKGGDSSRQSVDPRILSAAVASDPLRWMPFLFSLLPLTEKRVWRIVCAEAASRDPLILSWIHTFLPEDIYSDTVLHTLQAVILHTAYLTKAVDILPDNIFADLWRQLTERHIRHIEAKTRSDERFWIAAQATIERLATLVPQPSDAHCALALRCLYFTGEPTPEPWRQAMRDFWKQRDKRTCVFHLESCGGEILGAPHSNRSSWDPSCNDRHEKLEDVERYAALLAQRWQRLKTAIATLGLPAGWQSEMMEMIECDPPTENVVRWIESIVSPSKYCTDPYTILDDAWNRFPDATFGSELTILSHIVTHRYVPLDRRFEQLADLESAHQLENTRTMELMEISVAWNRSLNKMDTDPQCLQFVGAELSGDKRLIAQTNFALRHRRIIPAKIIECLLTECHGKGKTFCNALHMSTLAACRLHYPTLTIADTILSEQHERIADITPSTTGIRHFFRNIIDANQRKAAIAAKSPSAIQPQYRLLLLPPLTGNLASCRDLLEQALSDPDIVAMKEWQERLRSCARALRMPSMRFLGKGGNMSQISAILQECMQQLDACVAGNHTIAEMESWLVQRGLCENVTRQMFPALRLVKRAIKRKRPPSSRDMPLDDAVLPPSIHTICIHYAIYLEREKLLEQRAMRRRRMLKKSIVGIAALTAAGIAGLFAKKKLEIWEKRERARNTILYSSQGIIQRATDAGVRPHVEDALGYPLGHIDRVPFGDDAYLFYDWFDSEDPDTYCQLPARAAVQQSLEQILALQRQGDPRGTTTLTIQADAFRGVYPLPLRATLEGDTMKDGGHDIRFSMANYFSPTTDNTASIGAVQQHLPNALLPLTRPSLPLRTLPAALQRAVRTASTQPAATAAEMLRRTVQDYVAYDQSLECQEAYAQFNRQVLDGAHSQSYVEFIAQQKRGTCQQASRLLLELLRQAGIPALQGGCIWAQHSDLTTQDIHVTPLILLRGMDGRLQLKPCDGVGIARTNARKNQEVPPKVRAPEEWQRSPVIKPPARGIRPAEATRAPSLLESETDLEPDALGFSLTTATAAAVRKLLQRNRKTDNYPDTAEKGEMKEGETAPKITPAEKPHVPNRTVEPMADRPYPIPSPAQPMYETERGLYRLPAFEEWYPSVIQAAMLAASGRNDAAGWLDLCIRGEGVLTGVPSDNYTPQEFLGHPAVRHTLRDELSHHAGRLPETHMIPLSGLMEQWTDQHQSIDPADLPAPQAYFFGKRPLDIHYRARTAER